MKPSNFKLFLFIAVFLTLFSVSSHGKAICDYDKTPVSIKAENKPITEILKQIDEQTQFTINTKNEEVVSKSKSIELDQIPLDQTLKRLLTKVNYSVICDNNQESLTVVFLDKSTIPSSAQPQGSKKKPQQKNPRTQPPPTEGQDEIQERPTTGNDKISRQKMRRRVPAPPGGPPRRPPPRRNPQEMARIKAEMDNSRRIESLPGEEN